MTFAISEFASRPVETGAALRVAFILLGATVALAAAPAILSRGAAPSAAPIVAVAAAEHAQDRCRFAPVETDEGHGVRGQALRVICRKAR